MNLNIDRESSLQELILFVRDQIREYKGVITRETSIEDDLGVTGEEAVELLDAFTRKFNVEIGNFDFKKHFNDEPLGLTFARKLLPFTIGHLEKAMIAGKLDEEVINS